MKARSLIYLLLCTLPLMSAECFKKKDSPTAPAHETKIVVQLSGEYRNDEGADVSIDGGGVTSIITPSTAYATVEPGTHSIFATAHILKGTWSHTTQIKEGETKTINLPCDNATVIVKPDILWAGTINRFRVDVDGKSKSYRFYVNPGLEGSVAIRPEENVKINVYPEQFGTAAIASATHSFFYQEKFTLTVPF